MRYFIQPRNFQTMPRTGSLGRLCGLGMNPNASGAGPNYIVGPGIRSLQQPGYVAPVTTNALATRAVTSPGFTTPVFTGPAKICPAWGCGGPPVRIVSVGPAAPAVPTPTAGGSTAQQVAGTPVPVGYNTNSVFIASNGSQWEYSTTQGAWINVGTPYNLNAPSAPTPVSSASTAAQVAGSPVPVGYPTTAAYADAYGNTWTYNAQYGVWTETTPASSVANALTAGSAGSVPAGTPTNAQYTDANGNTWVYNPSTGAWTIASTATASPYDSILNFLSATSLGSAVGIAIPNWITLAALGFVALKFSQPSTGRR